MRDAAITFGIRVLSAGLVFGLQVLLARLMNLSSYGNYVTLWTWLITLGSFGALGFAESSVRFLPRYASRGRTGAAEGFFRIGFATVLTVSTAVAAAALAVAVLAPGVSPSILLYLALGLPFMAIENYLEGVARANGWFRLTAVPFYIVRPLLIAAVCLLLAEFGVELDLPVVGAVVIASMASIVVVLATVMLRRLLTARRPAVSGRQRALWWRASLPLLLVAGLEDLITYADVLLLSLLLPAEQVGVYFAAARTLALANFVYYALFFVAGRGFSLAHATRDRGQLQAIVLASSRLTFWLTLLALALTLAAGPLLLAAFGPEFAAAYPVMAILAVGLLVRAASGQASEVLLVAGRQVAAMALNATVLITTVVTMVIIVPHFGIFGAAAAVSAGFVVRTMVLTILLKRIEGLDVISLRFPALPKAA